MTEASRLKVTSNFNIGYDQPSPLRPLQWEVFVRDSKKYFIIINVIYICQNSSYSNLETTTRKSDLLG